MIYLVSGLKRSGKDYVAEQLQHLIPEANIVHMADALKDIMAITFNIPMSVLEELKNDETNVSAQKVPLSNMRKVLQRFGTDAMHKYFGDTVWVDLLVKQLSYTKTYIIPDWRFPIEYERLCESNLVVKTIRVVDNNLKADEHISERALDGFEFDYVIDNTAKVELDLSKIVTSQK